MIIHLKTDIQECEVKQALGSIPMNKVSGGDEIPGELFQVLRGDAVKVLHFVLAMGLEKVSFHSSPKER